MTTFLCNRFGFFVTVVWLVFHFRVQGQLLKDLLCRPLPIKNRRNGNHSFLAIHRNLLMVKYQLTLCIAWSLRLSMTLFDVFIFTPPHLVQSCLCHFNWCSVLFLGDLSSAFYAIFLFPFTHSNKISNYITV